MNGGLAHLALHSIGLAAGAMVVAVVCHLGRHRPIGCHRLVVIALAGSLLLPLVQLAAAGRAAELGFEPLSWSRSEGSASPSLHPSAGEPTKVAPVPNVAPIPNAAPAPNVAPIPNAEPGSRRPPAAVEPTARPAHPASDPRVAPAAASSTTPSAPPSPRSAEPPRAPATDPGPSRLLLAAYLAGLVVCALVHLARTASTARILARALPLRDALPVRAWQEVARRSSWAHRVRLLQSEQVAAPACGGWRRPCVVLPAGFVESSSPEGLRWALRHELVHLERGDLWVCVLQRLVTTVFWFHPAAWWLSRTCDRLREASCDELVVQRHGNRKGYALALLESARTIAGLASRRRAPALAGPAAPTLLSWGRSRPELRRRIEMLISRRSPGRHGRGRIAARAALFVIASAQLAAAAVLLPGQDPRPIPDPAPRQDPGATEPSSPLPLEAAGDDELSKLRAQVQDLKDRLVAAEKELLRTRSLQDMERRLAALEARMPAPASKSESESKSESVDLKTLWSILERRFGPAEADGVLHELRSTTGNESRDTSEAEDAGPPAEDPAGSRPSSRIVRALDAARRDLDSPDPAVRWQALETISAHPRHATAGPLIPLLSDTDAFVQLRAITLMSELTPRVQDREALAALVAALDDGDDIVRKKALEVLSLLTGQEFPGRIDGSARERNQLQHQWQSWLRTQRR